MQTVHLGPEALLDALDGQLDELADARHAELFQRVARRRGDRQPVERDASRRGLFFARRLHDDGPLLDLGQRIGPETTEADHGGRKQTGTLQVRANQAGPATQGIVEPFQPACVEPEGARFVGGRFDVRGEIAQSLDQRGNAAFDLASGHDRRAQSRGERQTRGVAHPGTDAHRTRAFVDPQDHPLRLVGIDHGHRMFAPVRVLPQQQLQRENRQINTGHPVHDKPPCAPNSARCACP